eukprot:GFUD01000364.1.p1 GENE.GFUD01000364.1~~GFUD01000364.1.p1  ORF type:complete len:610 (-),score=204.58 GFUD01000364.1:119-1900(-)
MVHNAVPALEDLCLVCLESLVSSFSLHTAKQIIKLVPDMGEESGGLKEHAPGTERPETDYTFDRQDLLQHTVDQFGGWVMSHIVWYLEDRVFNAVLVGLDRATRIHKASWTSTTDNRIFTKILYGIMKFTEVVVLPKKRILLLDQIPQILRNKLYSHLPEMENLTVLNLGSGSGGSVTEAFEDRFIAGVTVLKKLNLFTLRYDCTDNILKVLSATCGGTLRTLDLERSRKVTDDSIQHIVLFTNLVSLGIFNTALSTRGQAQLLKGLKMLKILPRGDFLCEALEYLEEEEAEVLENLQLGIQGFWASEEYYFHSSDQLLLVAKICPCIETMLFMFNKEEAKFQDITAFSCLQEFDIWGGDFYSDELYVSLEQVGPQLTKLNLVHIEELDKRAIVMLSQSCNNLKVLGFYNCGFREPNRVQEERNEEDEAFVALDRMTRRQEDQMMMQWLDVEKLNITSEIGPQLLVFLVSMCLNLTHLSLGMNTSISDLVLQAILSANSLQHLQHFKCAQTSHLTMKSVDLLLLHCHHLTACLSLEYWEGINDTERERFRDHVRRNNMKLLTTDETGNEEDFEKKGGLCTTSNIPENPPIDYF